MNKIRSIPATRAADFDEVMGGHVQEANVLGLKVVVLLTASRADDGEPWCSDCQTAEPLVLDQLERRRGIMLVACPVGRAEWKDKEAPHPYRSHAVLQAVSIPTLLRWNDDNDARLVEGECADAARLASFCHVQEWFDPHFHLWDMGGASGHDAAQLFSAHDQDLYDITAYEKDVDMAGPLFRHTGGVFLEATSVCFVDTKANDMLASYKQELAWASPQLAASKRTYGFVAGASLEAENFPALAAELIKDPSVRGVRQILNVNPDWPRNTALGDLLGDDAWCKGFALLADYGLSFDMQINANQFKKAAALISKHPSIPVIINHMGCGTSKDIKTDIYWDGIALLAKCSNTYLKVSQFWYMNQKWSEDETTVTSIHRLISLFGPKRCMFASNYPVDIKHGWPAAQLLPAFLKVASRYTAEEREALFQGTARTAYRIADEHPKK